MAKFIKKLMPIEAKQFLITVKPYPDGVIEPGMCKEDESNGICNHLNSFHVHTVVGSVTIHDEDFIIKELNGECWPMNPEMFIRKYEKVEE